MKTTLQFLSLFLLVFNLACQPSSGGSAASPTSPPPPSAGPQGEPSQPGSPEEGALPPGISSTASAEKIAIPFTEIAKWGVGGVPAWPGTLEELNRLVQEGRNARLYQNPNPGEYLRRAPWFYSGGCYAKAAHLSAMAEKAGYPRAGKVFAFGGWATLRYKSPYIPKGVAWWSYHVVAAYHLNSQVYVLDPLVSSERALTVDEWLKVLAPRPEKISLSFCDQNIYWPADRCLGGNADGAYTGDLPEMLRIEYRDLQSIGYDPDTLL